MNTYIPEGYQSLLGVYDTQKAIGLLKRLFEDQLAANLNLFRVSAPLFLAESSVRSRSIFCRLAGRRRSFSRLPSGSAWPSIAMISTQERVSIPI